MAPQDSVILLAEVQSLKVWMMVLSIALILLCCLFSIIVFFMLKSFFGSRANMNANVFEHDAAKLLEKNESKKLKELALARINEAPEDETALFYLGLAHFGCNEFIESKQCFTELMKKNVLWQQVAKIQLEIIEDELAQIKPRLV